MVGITQLPEKTKAGGFGGGGEKLTGNDSRSLRGRAHVRTYPKPERKTSSL